MIEELDNATVRFLSLTNKKDLMLVITLLMQQDVEHTGIIGEIQSIFKLIGDTFGVFVWHGHLILLNSLVKVMNLHETKVLLVSHNLITIKSLINAGVCYSINFSNDLFKINGWKSEFCHFCSMVSKVAWPIWPCLTLLSYSLRHV